MTDRAEAARKRIQSVQLREAGATYDEIAELVGWANRGNAHRAVMQALDDDLTESADRLRKLAYSRLERVLKGGLYDRALRGEHNAVRDLVLVMREQRRYIPGLEVPVARDDDATTQVGPITVILSMPEPQRPEPVPEDQLGAIDTTAVEISAPPREVPAGQAPTTKKSRAKRDVPAAGAPTPATTTPAVDPLEALANRLAP